MNVQVQPRAGALLSPTGSPGALGINARVEGIRLGQGQGAGAASDGNVGRDSTSIDSRDAGDQ